MAEINGIVPMNWQGFIGIQTGTRIINYYYDQCVALANEYSQGVVGAGFAAVNSAFQWWTNFTALGLGKWYIQSSTPVVGAIFVARGGIYNSLDGHIGVVTGLGNGVIYTMEQNTEVNRYVGRATRSATANILGYLIPRNNPAVNIGPTQRQVGINGVKIRADININSKQLGFINANSVQNIKGFMWGQDVNDGNIHTALWYVLPSGAFAWAGGFTAVTLHNLPDLTPKPAPKENERQVGKFPVKRRVLPSSKSAEVQSPLAANSTHPFVNWIRGEQVNDGIRSSNIWFQGASGNYFWAGGFTSQSTKGLKDINPKPPVVGSGERKVGANNANVRNGSTTTSGVVKSLKPGEVIKPVGYVVGQKVKDNIAETNIWFAVTTTSFAWAGAFTSQSIEGLKNITPVEPPKPPVEPDFKYQNPDIKNLTRQDFPAWINYEEVPDLEISNYTSEKWNTELYNFYKEQRGQDKQYYPEEVHAHWWDLPSKKPEHNAVVNYIKNSEGLTVNFVLSENKVTSMVPLEFMATTTGLRNPWGWKIEADPQLTEGVYKTLGALIFLVEKKNPRLKNEKVRLHKEFMATSCSEIDIKKVEAYRAKFESGEINIITGKGKDEEEPQPPTTKKYIKWEVSPEGELRGYIEA